MLRARNLMGKSTTAHDLKSLTNSDNSTADEGESDLAMALLSEEPLQPATMSVALTGPYAEQYQQVIEREFHCFATNSTFVPATIKDLQAHPGAKIIHSMLLPNVKKTLSGDLDFKVRCAAIGHILALYSSPTHRLSWLYSHCACC